MIKQIMVFNMYDIEKINQKFGEHIRILRQTQNLSQMDLADLSDLNTSYIGHLERGLKSPTLSTMAKLANALNVPLTQLVDFTDPKQSTSDAVSQLLREYTDRLLALTSEE